MVGWTRIWINLKRIISSHELKSKSQELLFEPTIRIEKKIDGNIWSLIWENRDDCDFPYSKHNLSFFMVWAMGKKKQKWELTMAIPGEKPWVNSHLSL